MTTTMMPMRSLVALATIASIVSGCMVGPDYERPTAPEAPAFKEADGWKLGEPKDLAPRGAWWDAFADPDLDALVRQVAPDNLTVQVAAARVREAQASVRIARAPLWPAVGATGQAVRRSQTGAPGVSSVSNNYNAAIDLSWELDLWGGIRRGIESSEATAQASQADLAGAVLSTQALLAQDYLLLRVQDAEIKLLESSVAAFETSLTLTKNQLPPASSPAATSRSRAQLASTKAQPSMPASRARSSSTRLPCSSASHRRSLRSRRANSHRSSRRFRWRPPSCSSGVPTSPPPNAERRPPMRRSASPRLRSSRRSRSPPSAVCRAP
jgi:outer membrane protein TolC